MVSAVAHQIPSITNNYMSILFFLKIHSTEIFSRTFSIQIYISQAFIIISSHVLLVHCHTSNNDKGSLKTTQTKRTVTRLQSGVIRWAVLTADRGEEDCYTEIIQNCDPEPCKCNAVPRLVLLSYVKAVIHLWAPVNM